MEEVSDDVERSLLVTRLEQLAEEANRDVLDNEYSDYGRHIDLYNQLLHKLSRFFASVCKDFQEIPKGISPDSSPPNSHTRLRQVASDANALLRGIEGLMRREMPAGEEPRTGPLAAVLPQGVPLPNALVGHEQRLEAFLSANPFEQNVFIMAKDRNENIAHRAMIKDGLRERGLNPVWAGGLDLIDDLYNPIACLVCCKYGVALFDAPEPQQQVNPSVAYELGMMHLLGRECLILKSDELSYPPTDVLQKLYEGYEEDNLETIRHLIREWAEKLTEG